MNKTDKDVLQFVYWEQASAEYKPRKPLEWCEDNLLEALQHLRKVVDGGPSEEAEEFLGRMMH
jgi:hypothetical protein